MPKIEIKRASENINLFRNYKLYLDGKKLGTIAVGEIQEFDVTSGEHKLMAKIDWCSSPEISFTVNENETKYFLVKSFSDSVLFTPFSTPYYITFGRNKYLKLKEI